MDDAVASFASVTDTSPEVAKQYLEQAGGDLDHAVALFFAAGDDAGDQEGLMQASQSSQAAASSPPASATSSAATAPAVASPSRNIPPAGSSSKSRFGTLGGLASQDSDSDDDDEKRNLFAGGGKSGLSVQDPNMPKKGEDVRRDLLQKAQEGSLKRQKLTTQTPPASRASAFTGSGNTLGSDEVSSRHVPDPTGPATTRQTMPGGLGPDSSGQQDEVGDEEDAQVTRTLTFWRDGFSIDDGPLMSYQEHREVLEQLRDGRAPLSLLGVRLGQRVDVHIANRETETYTPPPKVSKPFEGEGNRLGAPSPAVASASMPGASPSVPSSASQPPKQSTFEVNPNEPMTQLQIRLADGSRVVGRFNHSHTVGDVQGYINASHAGLASRPYVLQTTFPSRELTDLSQTIKEANLLGSVVVMRHT